jgi:hypothetical protein
MKTLNEKLNICMIYYYKDFKALFNKFIEIYDLRKFKKTEFVLPFNNQFEISQKKNNLINSKNSIHIFYNSEIQFIFGMNIFCFFTKPIYEENCKVGGIDNGLLKFLHKVNLTEKKNLLKFIDVVTYNIMEITLEQEGYFDYFDSNFLYGSRLQLSLDFETIMEAAELNIEHIKFQLFENSTVNIRNENQVEFSNNISENEKIKFIICLSSAFIDG